MLCIFLGLASTWAKSALNSAVFTELKLNISEPANYSAFSPNSSTELQNIQKAKLYILQLYTTFVLGTFSDSTSNPSKNCHKQVGFRLFSEF